MTIDANVLTELMTSPSTNFSAVKINAPNTQLPRIGVKVSEKNLTYSGLMMMHSLLDELDDEPFQAMDLLQEIERQVCLVREHQYSFDEPYHPST